MTQELTRKQSRRSNEARSLVSNPPWNGINYWSIVALGFVLYVFGRERKRSAEESSGAPGEPKRIHRLFTGRS